MGKLPADLPVGHLRSVGGGQTSGLRGVRCSTQSVGAHMWNRRGLPGGPGGGRCRRRLDITNGTTRDEAAADLTRDTQLAASERARPGDRVTRARILWSLAADA